MSSSGLIYAGIVGAWAMYLVPVWLRREEQLNEARKKARYAAAIRTLGRTEQFERKVLAEEEALAATGTDGPVRPPVAKPAPKTVTKTAAPSTPPPAKALPAQPAKRDGAAKPATAAKPGKPGKSGKSAPSRAVPAALADAVKPADATTTTWRPAGAVPAASQRRPTVTSRVPQRPETAHRGILLMRRRRVVTTLFALATAGAAVSAVLGIAYIWAMLVPAAMFSFYIVNIRRDERLRAAERYRRRQAQLAAERRREREQRERERVQAEAAAAALSAEQEQRRQLARERSRQRLRGDGPGAEDFRRAANG